MQIDSNAVENIIIQFQVSSAMQHRRQSRFAGDNVKYSQEAKEFLSKYKVSPCTNQSNHAYELCHSYHNSSDRRRNPYRGHNLSYYPTSLCNCLDENCKLIHSDYEYYFHPFIYKTIFCPNSSCNLKFACYGAHQPQVPYLQKNYFFRFDLQTFKIHLCHLAHSSNGEYASCRFYHNESDRRRDHSQCASRQKCNNSQCPFAHNKIEQLYHPHRYKSKYCSKILKGQPCEYLQFCSFAHADEQLTIQLLHRIQPQDQQFLFFKFKTVWCPYTDNHQRSNCQYAHNFNDYRRDPLRFKYQVGQCPHWNKTQTIVSLDDCGCPYKLDCNKCHGWFQNKYHPRNMPQSNQTQQKALSKVNSPQKNSQIMRNQDGMGTGAPFYKLEQKKESRPNSRKCSEKSQPKQSNSQEDTKKDNKKLKGSVRKSYSTMKGVKSSKKGKHGWIFYFEEDGKLWLSSSSSQKSIKKSPGSSRKKQLLIKQSQSNKNSYTASFKKIIAQYGLQSKVLSLGIHQFSLLNCSQVEIANEECFSQLSSDQKQKLIHAVSLYNKDPNHLEYSQSFKSIFKRRQQQSILQKLHMSKISQHKLLNLSHNSINQLTFLAEQEKEKLPVILENYIEEHRDFKEINEMIKTETIPPP